MFMLIAGNTEMPDAMETIFQSALAFGRYGGVSIFPSASHFFHLDRVSKSSLKNTILDPLNYLAMLDSLLYAKFFSLVRL